MLVFASGAAAGPSNDPLTFQLQYGQTGHQTFDPVGWQTWCGDCFNVDYTTGTPWVVNPRSSWPYNLPTNGAAEPGCMWDQDDTFDYLSSGNVLAAGASAGVTECIYAGTNPGAHSYGYFGALIRSPSPDLVITETWTWAGGSVTTVAPAPVFDQATRSYKYLDCLITPWPAYGTPLVTIPGSNGGQAVPQLMTVSLSNPTSQKVGKTGGTFDYGLIDTENELGCQGYRQP